MPDVNELVVKDFFELPGFVVSTNVPFPVKTNNVNQLSDFDLVIRNTRSRGDKAKPAFELDRNSVRHIDAAVVEVKGWHGDPLTPGHLKDPKTRKSVLGFVESQAIRFARKATGLRNPSSILVLHDLAKTEPYRTRVRHDLEGAGVGHVLFFREIVESLAKAVEKNRHYAHSPTLHLLRLLKNYEMLK